MPHPVSRDDALAAISREVPPDTCPMCFVASSVEPLFENAVAIVTMNGYPLRWGHLLVVLRQHQTSFSQLSERDHEAASALVHRAARAIEIALAPPRVFVASLGAPDEGLQATTPHLHWHLVPIANADERPRDIFTWQNGVLGATHSEWVELRAQLTAAARRG